VQRPTSTVSSAEAERKRTLLLDAAAAEAVVASSPATVRWLLCGRGRPVSTTGPDADYTVVLTRERAAVLHPDIESSRVEAEERLDELGFEAVTFPWYEGREPALRDLLGDARPLAGAELEAAAAPLRQRLGDEELDRYRAAGADAAEAMAETLAALSPRRTELEAAAELGSRLRSRGFTTPVLLAAGEERQGVHRHPLPTGATLGRHALLAATAERHGLHVSLTRIVAFGAAPAELVELCRRTAAVDAVALHGSRPGRTLGEVFAELEAAYAAEGFPGEWRRHHQGGLTGYLGREVFAVPGEGTPIPAAGAVAWNPSLTGGAKSEDTALVSGDGVEIVTRTPELPEWTVDGLARPAIVES
jgi:Xaa-Pro aminopeptidase